MNNEYSLPFEPVSEALSSFNARNSRIDLKELKISVIADPTGNDL